MIDAREVLAHVPEDVPGHGQFRGGETTCGGHLIDQSLRSGGGREVVVDDRDVELLGVNGHATPSFVPVFNQSLLHRAGHG